MASGDTELFLMSRDDGTADSRYGSIVSRQSSMTSKTPSVKKNAYPRIATLSSAGSINTIDTTSKSSKSRASKEKKSPSVNKIDDKTEEFRRHEEIYRKFRVAVKQTEDFVKDIEKKSEHRIQERSIGLEVQSKVDDDLHMASVLRSETQEKYMYEVDKAIEDQAQLRAAKQYHMAHIDLLLPEWCRVVDGVLQVINGCGHNNKLQWRSKAKTMLQQSLDLMECDASAKEAMVRVRRLVLEMNAHKAQQVIRILRGIKSDYVVSLEGASALGQHNSELKKIEKQLTRRPVPLARREWSAELQASHVSQSTSSLLTRTDTSARDVHLLDPLPSTSAMSSPVNGSVQLCGVVGGELEHSTFSHASSEEEDPYLSHRTEPFAVTTLPLLVYPPAEVKTPAAALKLLRGEASRGRLRECWGLFNCLYGEFLIAEDPEKFARSTLKAAPTLDVFKLLFTAFKNSSSQSYVDVANIFTAMRRLKIEPDVATYNLLMKACERRGAWRRALALVREMQDNHGLVPNTNTYATLMDCCRHAPEDPATIFETLRNEDLPRK